MTTLVERQQASSPLHGAGASYVESLYEIFLKDRDAVPADWRAYFASLGTPREQVPHGPIVRALARRMAADSRPGGALPGSGGAARSAASEKQAAVSRLIQVYSLRGHQIADLDPLGLWQRHMPTVLKLEYLGVEDRDLEREFFTGGLAGTGDKRMRLVDILALLRRIYCGRLAAEFAHISRARERLWLREHFEAWMSNPVMPPDQRRAILASLTRAEGIERFLNTKYVGQKRFSLEGGETLIPMLDGLIQRSGADGIQEIVIGMAHRGRLNVLVNVLGKSPRELFTEFEGAYDLSALKGSGDVKYHMGFSSDLRTPGGNVHVALAFNPSHLEIVNPVVEGSVRARQDRRGDRIGKEVLPVLIHGDASVAGQGVVAETLQLSQTPAFYTGGTVHIVVNNQIGFTASDPNDLRSTAYPSDIAKMVEAPVFHVNGDDPEGAVAAIELALRYRQEFRKDVVVDLVCYRRLGHNEADEPAATQPIMYHRIRQHPSVRTLYAERLVDERVVDAGEPDQMGQTYLKRLDEGQNVNDAALGMIGNKYTVDWSRYQAAGFDERVATAVSPSEISALSQRITELPEGFKLHSRVQKIIDDRRRMAIGEAPVDWGYAETLAYASLLTANFHVRLIGQDSRRGTFFHRHATLFDQETGHSYTPLAEIGPHSGTFTVTDSLLSEEAVLGFEYGYSTTAPDSLVIWEAQFGDFVNGAQVVIDQFISSGEAKWGRLSGLTLFLPHGYEGQGPEHSSARLERFLQLCAEHNMQVCVPSTPAQMFHMLRRQMLRPLRKPLVVMTPKSLLRHRLSVSSLEELSQGRFQPVIGDTEITNDADVQRVVFCSGKVYYDLAESRRAQKLDHIALIRIEELYPFPTDEYAAVVRRYANAHEIIWCQEEPQNQGAWYQIRHRLQEPLGAQHTLYYAGRAGAAAPACGIHALHVRQQEALVAAALSGEPRESVPLLQTAQHG